MCICERVYGGVRMGVCVYLWRYMGLREYIQVCVWVSVCVSVCMCVHQGKAISLAWDRSVCVSTRQANLKFSREDNLLVRFYAFILNHKSDGCTPFSVRDLKSQP